MNRHIHSECAVCGAAVSVQSYRIPAPYSPYGFRWVARTNHVTDPDGACRTVPLPLPPEEENE